MAIEYRPPCERAQPYMPEGEARKRVAARAGIDISRQGFRKWFDRHDGLARKIGGRWIVSVDRLDAILDRGAS